MIITTNLLKDFDYVRCVKENSLTVPVHNDVNGMSGAVYVITPQQLFSIAESISDHAENNMLKAIKRYENAQA